MVTNRPISHRCRAIDVAGGEVGAVMRGETDRCGRPFVPEAAAPAQSPRFLNNCGSAGAEHGICPRLPDVYRRLTVVPALFRAACQWGEAVHGEHSGSSPTFSRDR